ncbi:MAG: hypothetical protein Q8O82_19125 [Pseudorhodobacter sp.]|nr:hypothetical protein [Pseudorhodobacter sp.]
MNTLAAFMVVLKMMESGGDYQSVNSLNFLGAYQFGEAALTDLGFVRYDGDAYDNDYGGGWTGKYGVKSAKQFLASERAQDKAMEKWLEVMWSYIELHKVDRYAWREVGRAADAIGNAGRHTSAGRRGTGRICQVGRQGRLA